MIDLDQLIPGSAFFRWREALFLPKWGICVYPPPDIHRNIISFAKNVADPIRNLIGKPIQVHSWYRPPNYNHWATISGVAYGVNGAPNSMHLSGRAFDFSVYTMSLDEIEAILKPRLENMGIRMEQPDGQQRIHVDDRKVFPGESRYFKRG